MILVWLLLTFSIWLLGRGVLFYINPNAGVGLPDLIVMAVIAAILLPLYAVGSRKRRPYHEG